MTSDRRNNIGITTGDPAGIGPEILCKALADMSKAERAEVIVVGTGVVLERANALVGAGLTFVPLGSSREEPAVALANIDLSATGLPPDGEVSAAGGTAACAYVVKAADLARRGDVGVMVTAPLNKAALHAAGHMYDGHLGLLAELTDARSTCMALISERLSTVYVSTHVSLAEAITRVTTERVLDVIRTGHVHFRRMGVARPRIAVAGLNPHCGENGAFGREDLDQIAPAVRAAQAVGIDAVGPIPPDTVFHRAYNGAFDLVVAQYHDQGHAPTKLVAFDTAVNVSLGLPIDRTSVDHGTAFDIAWQGVADATNMKAAIAYARRLAETAREE